MKHFLAILLLAVALPAAALSIDDLVTRGVPPECINYDPNWSVEPVELCPDPVDPPPDPVEPPPDPVDPPPPPDLGLDVGVQVAACDYDASSGLSVAQCPTRQALSGAGAYLKFNGMDLRNANCVTVLMPNEANRGIVVQVNGTTLGRLPSAGPVTTQFEPMDCTNCTVQLYQDGSFGSTFVWLYWLEFGVCN